MRMSCYNLFVAAVPSGRVPNTSAPRLRPSEAHHFQLVLADPRPWRPEPMVPNARHPVIFPRTWAVDICLLTGPAGPFPRAWAV